MTKNNIYSLVNNMKTKSSIIKNLKQILEETNDYKFIDHLTNLITYKNNIKCWIYSTPGAKHFNPHPDGISYYSWNDDDVYLVFKDKISNPIFLGTINVPFEDVYGMSYKDQYDFDSSDYNN